MNKYGHRRRSKKEKVGFYVSLSICMAAVGLAAYSTYSRFAGEVQPTLETVAVERVVTGVTEKKTEPTQAPTTEAPTTAPPTTEPEETTEPVTVETKTPLQTMLTVNTSLSFPLDSSKIIGEYSEETVYNKTLNEWRAHPAIDFACKKGDNVYSMGEGEVVKVYTDDILGRTVVVKSATYTVSYSGLEKATKVKKGDEVKTGDVLGLADTVPGEALDEPHIHIEIKVDGQYVDPLSLINNNE